MMRNSKWLLALVAAFSAIPAVAQNPPAGGTAQTPQIVDDRTLGEEERLRRRAEWFFGSRRDGTASAEERSRLRSDAVLATSAALQLQRAQQATEAGSALNFWASKGPSPSTFGGWTFGNVSGRVMSIDADWAGGVLYLGAASGGVWKSTNDGLSWTSIFDSAGTQAIGGAVAVDPSDPDVIWVGTGDNVESCEGYFGIGLLRSPDGGATWEVRNGSGLSTLDHLASFASVVVDPRDSDHVVVGGRIRGCEDGVSAAGGIFTTTDGGQTWTERLGGRELYEIAQDPTLLDTYWAATSDGVFKSTNNGVAWTLQTASGLPTGNVGRTEIAIAPSDGQTVYALFDAGANSFWRTTNGGASWTQMSSGSDACDGQCWYNMVIRVDPTQPNTVYRGTVRLFKTVNGGSSWTALTSSWGSSQKVHQDTHALLMHPTIPGKFYVGSDGGIWKSEDGGSSFANLSGNLNVTQFYAVGTGALDPEAVICGGAQDNSSLARSTSDVWDLQFASGDGFVCHINPQDPNRAYVTSYPDSGFPSIYRSTTGLFGSFSEITFGHGIVGGERSNWVTPYLLDPASPNVLYLGTQRVYRSTNHGTQWTPQQPSDMTGGSGSLVALEINRNFPANLYTGSESGRVWRTENSGTTWTNITSNLPVRSVNDIAADPTNPDRAFAVLGGFNTNHLWEWNEGAGWTARGSGLPNVPANAILMLDANDLILGNDVGVFRSVDGGVTFTPYMAGLPQGLVVTDLKLDVPDLITAGTYGRGAWQVRVEAAAANVRYDSVELPLVESDGDGDAKVEPGETWSVRPLLRNLGGQAALGVMARLASATPGIQILEPSVQSFGDVSAGTTALPGTPFRFTVDPAFPCGGNAVFDVVDISSTNAPGSHPATPAAFTVVVLDHIFNPGGGGPAPATFGGDGTALFSQQIVGDGTVATGPRPLDTARLATKDGAPGKSFRFAGTAHGSQVWLHHGGTDSGSGPGVEIPADAVAAQLAIVHRYDTGEGVARGRVVIDRVQDGRDLYATLEPDGEYPGEREGFTGSSGGWVTSTFDLTRDRGQRVHLAFVYDSDEPGGADWTITEVEVRVLGPGTPVCDVTDWPGRVPPSLLLGLDGADVVASWGDSCNSGELAGQTYSLQAGDLDLLNAGGTFSHAPVGALCNLTSPRTFTPGAGNEYYLVVPNEGGREGGAGAQSSGAARPQTSILCGERREAACD